MKFYAVIDTNVVVSSMFRKGSVPGKIIDYAISGEIVPLLNDEILSEYEEVLLRNEFGFDENDVYEIINHIRQNAIFLDRTGADEIFPNPDDAVFYEIALTARKTAEAYLVTGNTKHFPVKPFVVTPREMLEIIEKK